MNCAQCREALSARLDGEQGAEEGVALDAHLRRCTGCRRFADDAARITRLARTSIVTETPDLTETVLAAAPRSRRPQILTALRVLLALVGLAQLTVAVRAVAAVQAAGHEHDSDHLSGAALVHFAHESAAWNLAIGAGFLWVAWRSSRTSGVVPTLATFVVVLSVIEVLDLVAGWVDPHRLAVHSLVLVGLVLVILLDRLRPPTGGTLPGGTSSGLRGSVSAQAPHPLPGGGIGGADGEDLPGLRPTARGAGRLVS